MARALTRCPDRPARGGRLSVGCPPEEVASLVGWHWSVSQGCEMLMRSLPRLRRVIVPVIAGLIAGLGIALAPASSASASDGSESKTEVRIAARVLAGGNKEFAIQVRPAGGVWEGRQLPPARFVLANVTVARWVASTPLALDTHAGAKVDDKEATATARILARRLEDGRTEVALQMRRGGEEWGHLQLPCQRFLPVQAPPGRWFATSPSIVPGKATESPSGIRQSSRPTPPGIVPMFGICENEEQEWLRAVRDEEGGGGAIAQTLVGRDDRRRVVGCRGRPRLPGPGAGNRVRMGRSETGGVGASEACRHGHWDIARIGARGGLAHCCA